MKNINDEDFEFIEEFSIKYSINLSNVYHFSLDNEIEILAENVREDSDFIYLRFPIRILKDYMIDPDANFYCDEVFTKWNPYTEQEIIPFAKSKFISPVRPDDNTLLKYIRTLYALFEGPLKNKKTEDVVDEFLNEKPMNIGEGNVIKFPDKITKK